MLLDSINRSEWTRLKGTNVLRTHLHDSIALTPWSSRDLELKLKSSADWNSPCAWGEWPVQLLQWIQASNEWKLMTCTAMNFLRIERMKAQINCSWIAMRDGFVKSLWNGTSIQLLMNCNERWICKVPIEWKLKLLIHCSWIAMRDGFVKSQLSLLLKLLPTCFEFIVVSDASNEEVAMNGENRLNRLSLWKWNGPQFNTRGNL